jgi:hypothetical protein
MNRAGVQVAAVVTSLVLMLAGCTAGSGGSDGSSGGSTGASTGTSTGTPTSSGGSESGGSESGGDELQFCEEQHVETIDGQSVVVCDVAFTDPPFVHLPPSKQLAEGHVEAHLALRGQGFTDGGDAFPFTGTPEQFEAEALRHAFAIYRVELDDMGVVVGYAPAVYIDERNFLRAVAGQVMQGTIARKTGDSYESDPTVPIHVTFGAAELTDDTTPGMARYALPIAVNNLAGAVTGEDGTCLPSMASYGPENPFSVYPSALVFARVPSMHGPFDDVATVAYTDSASVMAGALYFDPLDLIQATAPKLDLYEGYGHGTPGSIPNLFVQPVSGGGADCTP